jgi:hypothetical protein
MRALYWLAPLALPLALLGLLLLLRLASGGV